MMSEDSTSKRAEGRRRPKSSTLRALAEVAVVVAVCVGLAFHTGTGTLSSWGIGSIAALCPLGAVEAAIASRTVVPPALIGLAIVAVLVLVFGRAFCAWGCPVPLLRRIFGGKKKGAKAEGGRGRRADAGAGEVAGTAAADGSSGAAKPGDAGDAERDAAAVRGLARLDVPAPKRGGLGDSRNWVLGGALLTTVAFGFPVFCLVCPVGLTFGTLVVVWRLFQFNEVTWSLVVFPAILVLELVVLRKWCHRFCPLGVLISLIARGNRTFRPQANDATCLHAAHGEACHRCSDVCPEGIDLHRREASAPMNECVKCRKCADACPVHAITFPLIGKGKEDSK